MKNKKILIFIFILFLIGVTFFIIFSKKDAKNIQIGNNKNSQEIVDYILNINSYELIAEVEVNSNKNRNKYILKQQYINPNVSVQEVIEPSNIAGTKLIKKDNKLEIKNTILELSTVFENYNCLGDNQLDLISFIEEYKSQSDSNYEEKNNQIIMNVKNNSGNKYIKNKTLYIDKTTLKPTKLEIIDDSKNTVIYILYNEVKINSINESDILS